MSLTENHMLQLRILGLFRLSTRNDVFTKQSFFKKPVPVTNPNMVESIRLGAFGTKSISFN